jgi:PAS domain S-box-containing protein
MRDDDRMAAQRSDVGALLRTEHAVARVLASSRDEDGAYPELLAAMGAALAWDFGAVWLPGEGETLECAATWPETGGFVAESRSLVLGPGEGLPGRVWAAESPAWITGVPTEGGFPRAAAATRAGLQSAFAFPVRGAALLAVIEFFTADLRDADEHLLDTMTSLGTQIGQFVERCRAEQAVRDGDARKSAILNAAFDCVVTMDHNGDIVEVNKATERTFGYTAAELMGRELAELMIPPDLREAHRSGLRRYIQTGHANVINHPIELRGMRADGSEFPVELAITRPELPGPPLFCGYLRDVTERKRAEKALRRLADEQAALRRVATAVAAETEPARVFSVVTEEVGRLLGAQTANMVRYDGGQRAAVVGGWNAEGVLSVPVGVTVELDGDTVAARVLRTERPARVDSYDDIPGEMAAQLRELGFRGAVAAPVMLGGRLWGAMIVSSVHPEPFPAGAEQRIADFAELAAQALANAQARAELAASRARIVEAGDAERRRLERNLHDGAQQRLVSLAVNLRLAARACDPDDATSRDAFERAGEELAQALAELRELARGIHPAVLSDRGLEPAIETLAARTPVPVQYTIQLDERLPEPVEAAAYYVVAEALTNAAKHASASEVTVRIERENGFACIEVADDGVGGAARDGGSGLRGLADRVEALGGRLALDSPAGEGTTVRAEIPSR